MAYHVDADPVPGGFLGVSLFFSLSGFLIIGRLVDERHRTGRIDLRRFWRRRVARLLPAFVVTVVATVVVVALRQPTHLDRVAADAVAGLANVANWHDLAGGVDYGTRFGGVDPLGHLWSLSIEEQFYLCVPIVVALVGARWGMVLAVTVVGAGIAWFWGSSDAYLASPMRFAEVLCGGLLGALVYRRGLSPKWLVRLSIPASVVGLGAFMIVEDSDPKLFELGLPLAGVVWTAVLAGAVVEGRVGTALAWSPLRWLGDRSYAIYLIHVPVMAATVAVNRTTPSVAAAVDAEVAATVTTAAITATTTTSTPFRPRSSRSSSGAAPVVSPARSTAPEVAPTTTTSTVPAPTPPPVVQRHPIRVLALGDSTMRHLTEPLEAWLALFGGEVVPRAVPGCSPLSTAPDPLEVRFDDTPKGQVPAGVCRPSVRDVIDRVGPVDVVVIVDHGMAVLDHRVPDGGHWSSLRNADIRGRLAHRYIAWARPRRSAHPWCW